ncbi:MAG: hypothetical protein AB7V77_00230 [Candidatus Woesearchaeota archaeon]
MVNGTVTIIGLGDYIGKNDKIKIIDENLLDDEGNPVKKGSIGYVSHINTYDQELPYEVTLEDDRTLCLNPHSFKVFRK